jgi:hypothetical protein
MSDGLFFTLIIGFFFIVWLVGGGPHRPISFTGPFITPITTVGEAQNAYGPNLSGKISAGGVTVGSSIPTSSIPANTTPDNIPNTSPYAGKVFLSHSVNGLGSANPAQEYLTLILSPANTANLDITGWRVVSIKTGTSAPIPEGAQTLTLGTVNIAPIELRPGAAANIISGFSPVNVSYEENECTNYLSNPSNYERCFSEHASATGFYTGNWDVYLNENHTLWQQSDTIELLDGNGKVVDSFAY